MTRKVLFTLLALTLAGCGGGDGGDGERGEAGGGTTAAAAEPVSALEVQLTAVKGSKTSGTVRLTPDEGDTLDVAIELDPPVDAGGSHIHTLSCADYTDAKAAETIFSDLGAIKGGKLKTTSGVSLADVRKGYSVNVHATEAPYPAIACGDIPRR